MVRRLSHSPTYRPSQLLFVSQCALTLFPCRSHVVASITCVSFAAFAAELTCAAISENLLETKQHYYTAFSFVWIITLESPPRVIY